MYTLLVSGIIFFAILVVLVVLAQNSKGGGLSNQFGGSGASNLIGVKKTGEPLSDPLIEDIKTKKKIDPESPKTKEQIEIIDQFIKAQPSIKPKANVTPPSDLADMNNSEFADNIVSETLAKILIRQGKKEKAIEVYKKLIWKFPQKKVYFAAQIEELKK